MYHFIIKINFKNTFYYCGMSLLKECTVWTNNDVQSFLFLWLIEARIILMWVLFIYSSKLTHYTSKLACLCNMPIIKNKKKY